MAEDRIENVLHESRVLGAPPEAVARAGLSEAEYRARHALSLQDPDGFWREQAAGFTWFKPVERVLEWEEPFARWFSGGETNMAFNCLDRHLPALADTPAIVWEGEPGDTRTLTYAELHAQVGRFSNVLKGLGVKPGDRVTIYLPLIPEAAVAMLACARIGAVHSVIFGGFSAGAVADRVRDAGSKVIVTADGGYRRGGIVPLKANVDEALTTLDDGLVEHVIVARRTGHSIEMQAGRDAWLDDLLAAQASSECPAESLESSHPLFILYTSGSTGKPKGVLHGTGGYMVWTGLTARDVFTLQPGDRYWCTADVGWVTGHSYVVYGPLLNGVTSIMFEGALNYPDAARPWKIIERHHANVLYTAPTAIRGFMRSGDELPARHNLSSLRLLGSVGEPINPEAWLWYRRVIGRDELPIVDTWWQTETGGVMLTTLPGTHAMKPGSAGLPMWGVDPAIVDRDGRELGPDEGGFLVIRRPWPGLMQTIYGDDARYRAQYWSEVPGVYFSGDGARRDADGYITIVGRIDDVLNVAGHRLGTMEVESALVSHPAVAEAAVVGRPDPIKGEGIIAFVVLKTGWQVTPEELREHVTRAIGAIARPDQVRISESLPKTRSGKIMRRFLRQVASGEGLSGDTSTLEDAGVIKALQDHADE